MQEWDVLMCFPAIGSVAPVVKYLGAALERAVGGTIVDSFWPLSCRPFGMLPAANFFKSAHLGGWPPGVVGLVVFSARGWPRTGQLLRTMTLFVTVFFFLLLLFLEHLGSHAGSPMPGITQ